MQYFEFLAIFIAPIFGVLIMNNKYKYQIKDFILNYFNIIIVSNLVTNILIFVLKYHTELIFTPSFFIKYSLINIIFSIFIALLEIIIIENIKVKLIMINDKKK